MAGVVDWHNRIYTDIGFFAILAWPSIWLARLGMSPTWPVALFILLSLPAIPLLVARRRGLSFQWAVIVTLAVTFCVCGNLRIRWAVKNTFPTENPYPPNSVESVSYASGYSEGFSIGETGILSTHCFAPYDETRGYEQGMRDSDLVWKRFYPF